MNDGADNHTANEAPRLLVIETAHKIGLVALALGERVVGGRRLDEARRHARDLVPALRALLAEQGWTARALDAVVVSRGPGSYTGLRVGVVTAKTIAYAARCDILAVDTFTAIALQAPPDALSLDVIADAQQDKLYVQRFTRTAPGAAWTGSALAIEPFAAWQPSLDAASMVTGPGLERFAARLDGARLAPADDWYPRVESLVRLGMERWRRGECDDPFAVEPLYLRPSSAEEKWQR